VELERTERGSIAITRVRTASCEVEVTDHGAQVLRWRPTGLPDVLWTSPAAAWERGKAVRGGVPLCFPWFGARGGGAPSHGFARLVTWAASEPEPDGEGVRFRWLLEQNADTTAWWPHPFRLELQVVAGPRGLTHVVRLENGGPSALPCELALHGYFAVDDVRRVRLHGLSGGPALDKVTGAPRPLPDGPFAPDGATDLVCAPAGSRVSFVDPAWGRRVTVDREGADRVVVWNPGAAHGLADVPAEGWRGFVCVETAAVGDAALVLPPGGARVVSQHVGLEEAG
jgi:glucose-6-phosphate 1-epimerase